MQTQGLDQPQAVRPGEELPAERLAAYLMAQRPELSGPLTVRQFGQGYSNLTYLVQMGDHALVLRRPPVGASVKGGHDMGREYRMLQALSSVYPLVPRPLLLCTDASIMGVPFYVMERVQGVILRAKPPAGLVLTASLMQQLSEATIDNLAVIHAVDHHAPGLAELGHPAGYVRRQVEGWTKRYYAAHTDDVPSIERVIRWLSDHMPSESGTALIHNDYKYDNLVLDPSNLSHIRAVLDWEMATIGDPLMDLGTTLGYWVDPDDPDELQQSLQFNLTTLPGNLHRTALAERYAQRSGRPLTDLTFYYVYGLFKIAVIVQQIYARYQQGLTKDPRFAQLILAVRACGNTGALAIDKRRISRLLT
ncbi:MAG: phosphotransferase family protein [Herpetosiphonaceae bacterium]|nr:phosphotransferase family protein [Herpetosiphonaceae bacterium]